MIMKDHAQSITEWLDDTNCINEIVLRSANIEIDNKIYNVRWDESVEDFSIECIGEIRPI